MMMALVGVTACGDGVVEQGDFDLPPYVPPSPPESDDQDLKKSGQDQGEDKLSRRHVKVVEKAVAKILGGELPHGVALRPYRTSAERTRSIEDFIRRQSSSGLARRSGLRDRGGSFGHPQARGRRGLVPPPPPVVGLFGDCVSSSGATASSAPPTPGSDYAPSGQVVRLIHKRIESTSDLHDTLNVAVGVGHDGAPSWKGGVDLNKLRELKVTRESRWYFYMIEVKNPLMKMRDLKLTPGAYRLYRQRGQEALYHRCGEDVFTGYQTGGYLMHVIRISKKTQGSTDHLDHMISASGFGFNTKGQLEIDDDADLSELDIDIHTRWRGGRGVPAHTTIEDIRRMSEVWPVAVADHGILIRSTRQPLSDFLEGLHTPKLERIVDEIRRYDAQLTRLSAIKERLLIPEFHQKVAPTAQQMSQLQSLISRLSRKVEVCERSQKIASCQDMKLFLHAQKFDISITAPHQSCGVSSWHYEDKRHQSCGVESYSFTEEKRHPSCEVEKFMLGELFSGTIELRGAKNTPENLEASFPSECSGGDVERQAQMISEQMGEMPAPKCSPRNDDCLWERGVPMLFARYQLSCWARRPEFGVERYHLCKVTEQGTRYKLCPQRTSRAKEFHSCVVPLEEVSLETAQHLSEMESDSQSETSAESY